MQKVDVFAVQRGDSTSKVRKKTLFCFDIVLKNETGNQSQLCNKNAYIKYRFDTSTSKLFRRQIKLFFV